MESYGARPVVDVDNRPLGPTQNTDLRLNTGDVGILKSTLLPSFTLHSGLILASYVAARATDKGELKDYNWPSSQVANAWWSAIGRRMYHDHLPFTTAWNVLPWNEKLLLGSVTLWGTRLFYHIVSRSVSRGKDDPRYDELKEQDSGFWNKAFYLLFVPEAVFLTFISLPFTLPFRLSSSSLSLAPEVSCALRSIGVGLFGAGFALETLADTQLTLHRRERADLCRHGVWSIVRHPNYLGDTLVHSSFILLNAVNNFNPFILLGPLANYLYLRLVGGDKQNEPSQEARYQAKDPHKLGQLQEWRSEKNSFWPSLTELVNPWTWVVIGSGVLGVVVEEGARAYFA